MSTLYYLRRPMSEAEFREKARVVDWRMWRIRDGDEWWWDGEYSVVMTRDVNGNIDGFERFGSNRVGDLVRMVDAVSEHDTDDPDYAKLFDEEYEG